MTPSGIEPATIRLVAQCLNHVSLVKEEHSSKHRYSERIVTLSVMHLDETYEDRGGISS